jgi:KUP system potassium uptake protein
VTEDLGDVVYTELRKFITTNGAQHAQTSATAPGAASDVPQNEGATMRSISTGTPVESDAKLTRRLRVLDDAYSAQVVYIVGKGQLRLMAAKNNVFKRFVLGIFLWIRENTRAKVASMRIPVEKLVEVGFVKEL